MKSNKESKTKINALQKGIIESMLGFEAFNRGVNQGLKKTGQGIKQVGNNLGELVGFYPEGTANQYTKQADQENAAYEDEHLLLKRHAPIASGVGEFIGEAAPYAALPGGSLAKSIGSGLVQGGLQYIPEGGSRAESAAIGAGVSAGAHGALKLAAKGANSLKGIFDNPNAEEIVNLGKQHEVPVFYPDVINNRATKFINGGLEKTPFTGVKGQRENQMLAARDAAENLTNKIGRNLEDTPYNGIPELVQVAQSGSKRASAAQTALKNLENAGEDWDKIIKASGNTKLVRAKILSDDLFGNVEKLAEGKGNIDNSNIVSTLDEAIINASKGAGVDKTLIKELETLKNEFANQTLDFSTGRQTSSRIGKKISSYYKGQNALIGEEGVGALQKTKNAIDNELGIFAQNNGDELKNAWEKADKFYKSNIIPYKDTAIARAFSKDSSPDEIYSKFITLSPREGGKGTNKAMKFYNALDDRGREAVRYGMVSQAFEKANSRTNNTFNPAKFASELERINGGKSAFFKGEAKQEIDGFVKLMRQVERSKKAQELPETGVKVLPYVVGGMIGIGSGLQGLGASIAGMTALKGLFMTTPGRNFLLASSKLSPESTRYKQLLQAPALQKILNNANSLQSNPESEKRMDETFEMMPKEELYKLMQQEQQSSNQPYNYDEMSKEDLRMLMEQEQNPNMQ